MWHNFNFSDWCNPERRGTACQSEALTCQCISTTREGMYFCYITYISDVSYVSYMAQVPLYINHSRRYVLLLYRIYLWYTSMCKICIYEYIYQHHTIYGSYATFYWPLEKAYFLTLSFVCPEYIFTSYHRNYDEVWLTCHWLSIHGLAYIYLD